MGSPDVPLSQVQRAVGTLPNDPKKPILLNKDGTFSTEKTMTFQTDEGHVVLPTIVGGEEHSPKKAFELYRQGKNPAVGVFKTAKEADEYAQKRHLIEEKTRKAEADRMRKKKE